MNTTERITAKEFLAMQTQAKPSPAATKLSGANGGRSKYGAIRTEVDGITFDSRAEARRYSDLRILEKAGEIRELDRQVTYPFLVNGTPCGSYRADFVYKDKNGREVVEDVKSEPTKTPEYRLKKKLMLACYGVHIQEVK